MLGEEIEREGEGKSGGLVSGKIEGEGFVPELFVCHDRSEFVEVPKPPLMAKQIGTVIELTSASGSRLTVRLSESVDVGLLLSQFQARQ